MDVENLLQQILARYGNGKAGSRKLNAVARKVSDGLGDYADAQNYAIEAGRLLTNALREDLPEALTDGRLYREFADVLVRTPLETAGRDVAQIATAVQESLNQAAGIGLSAIVPEMNEDQVTGIITGICNADSYEAGKNTMLAQVENCLEGYVDDFVRENADFQYKAGLSPTIERKTTGKCCTWCSDLAGNYLYSEVRDRGNDVFKRHKYCHCQVLFNPGNGSKRRQNVHTRQWTDEGKTDRIVFAKSGSIEHGFRTKADPMREAMGSGEVSHPREIEAFRQEAAKRGVDIIEHDYESLGYSPNIFAGQPGTLYISKGASYPAWCHEMQHMRDDYEAGWSGMRILQDPDERFNREQRAYNIEIRMAEEIGRTDLAQRLRDNLEAARRDIYGTD